MNTSLNTSNNSDLKEENFIFSIENKIKLSVKKYLGITPDLLIEKRNLDEHGKKKGNYFDTLNHRESIDFFTYEILHRVLNIVQITNSEDEINNIIRCQIREYTGDDLCDHDKWTKTLDKISMIDYNSDKNQSVNTIDNQKSSLKSSYEVKQGKNLINFSEKELIEKARESLEKNGYKNVLDLIVAKKTGKFEGDFFPFKDFIELIKTITGEKIPGFLYISYKKLDLLAEKLGWQGLGENIKELFENAGIKSVTDAKNSLYIFNNRVAYKSLNAHDILKISLGAKIIKTIFPKHIVKAAKIIGLPD